MECAAPSSYLITLPFKAFSECRFRERRDRPLCHLMVRQQTWQESQNSDQSPLDSRCGNRAAISKPGAYARRHVQAIVAVAVIGPIPGIATRRLHCSSSPAMRAISLSVSSICPCRYCISNRSWVRSTRNAPDSLLSESSRILASSYPADLSSRRHFSPNVYFHLVAFRPPVYLQVYDF